VSTCSVDGSATANVSNDRLPIERVQAKGRTVSKQTEHRQVASQTGPAEENTGSHRLLPGQVEDDINLLREALDLHRSVDAARGMTQ
jgi:hypothetical protein